MLSDDYLLTYWLYLKVKQIVKDIQIIFFYKHSLFPKNYKHHIAKIFIKQHQTNHRKTIHLKGYDMTNLIIFRNQFSSIWRLKVVTTQNIAKNIEVQSLWNGNQWITEANELTMFISQAIYFGVRLTNQSACGKMGGMSVHLARSRPIGQSTFEWSAKKESLCMIEKA